VPVQATVTKPGVPDQVRVCVLGEGCDVLVGAVPELFVGVGGRGVGRTVEGVTDGDGGVDGAPVAACPGEGVAEAPCVGAGGEDGGGPTVPTTGACEAAVLPVTC
jgi:hypothetical protein